LKDAPVAIGLLMRFAAQAGRGGAGPAAPAARRRFSTHVGRLLEGEIDTFMQGASPAGRVQLPPGGRLSPDQAAAEARRCLHCDCRAADDCKLRLYAEQYGAKARRAGARRRFEQDASHAEVVYEPGKCITCGLCVRIAAEASEPIGLALTGRGFAARVGVPFGRPLSEGLQRSAAQCVAACPTGALAWKDSQRVPAAADGAKPPSPGPADGG